MLAVHSFPFCFSELRKNYNEGITEKKGDMRRIEESARIALNDCMALKKHESLLVLTDDRTLMIGETLFNVGKTITKESYLLVMTAGEVNGQEPPGPIADLMSKHDVVICPTLRSLTHTKARRDACKAGARVGTMPGITEEVMILTLKADYYKIAKRTFHLSKILDEANEVCIKTKRGTDIVLPLKGIKAISSTGLIREKGSYGNLPSGESFLMPVEGQSDGNFIVDGSFAGVGLIKEMPVKIEVKSGYATKIEGGKEAKKLRNMLRPFGKQAYTIAELGIGTNDQAIITGSILEDEKVMGTVHIALGNNLSMGGTCDVGIHLDGVILEPTVFIDNKMIMENGKFRIKSLK